ncbi:MAG: hypothetical protein AB1673_02880 [Actinomycetota bacterium]
MNKRRCAAVVCALALVVLSGCRDRSTAQDKADRLCREVAEVDAIVTQLAALEPTAANAARVGELRSRLESEYADVERAARDTSGLSTAELTAAYNQVLAATSGVNSEASLAQARPAINVAAGEFSSARVDLHTTGRC